MDATTTRRLIKKMLDSRDLMPETREELAEYLSDLNKGALHADDAVYIHGLARRLGHADGGRPADPYAAEAMGDSPAEEFSDDGDGTAAAVQAEIALRAVAQAQALAARLRAAGPADTATLDALDKALGEAAEALAPRA